MQDFSRGTSRNFQEVRHARGIYASGAGTGPGGRRPRRGAGGLRHRPGGTGGGQRPQPPGGEAAHLLPRRDGGHPAGQRGPRHLAAGRLRPLCDAGALSHVRRGHPQRPHSTGLLRRTGSGDGCLRRGAEPVHGGLPPSAGAGGRGAGGGLPPGADGFLPKSPINGFSTFRLIIVSLVFVALLNLPAKRHLFCLFRWYLFQNVYGTIRTSRTYAIQTGEPI